MRNAIIYNHLPEPFITASFYTRDKNWHLEPHFHSFFQTIFVLKGKLCVKNNNCTEIVSEGEMCAFPPNWVHSLSSPCGYSQIGIDICAKNSSDNIVKLLLNNVNIFFKADVSFSLKKHMLNINNYLTDMSIVSKLYFSAEVINMIAESFESNYSGNVQQSFKNKLQKNLEESLDSNLFLEDISKRMMVSIPHLERQCNYYFGMPVIQLFNTMKINRACYLLSHSNEQIKNIAKHLGFYDQCHFSKFFKQKTGLSPRKYRNNSKEF